MSVVEIIEATPRNVLNIQGVLEKVKKRVCAYCRVSTDMEDQISSYNSQIIHYSNVIKSNPDWIFVGIYADEGITGTQTKKRVEFLRMIEDCKRGKIDMIIAKSISRFARNTVDTLKYVRMLKGLGIDIYFEKENIHTLDMNNELLLTLFSAFAQGESESTSENVKLGYRAKMKRGEPCGTIACYGFIWDKINKEILINEKEAAVVRKIFDLYLKGFGSTIICKKLNEEGIPSPKGGNKWYPSVIKTMLRNEKYVGDLCGQKSYILDPITHKQKKNRGEKTKYYVKEHHAGIISREIYDKAQDIYNKRSIKLKDGEEYCEKFSMRYTYSSKIKCGNCGSNFKRRITHYVNKLGEKHSYVYWICSCKNDDKNKCDDRISIRQEELDSLFIELFNKVKKQYDNNFLYKKISEYINNYNKNNDIDTYKKKISEINDKISRLIDIKLSNNIDEMSFNNKYKELKKQLEEYEISINKVSISDNNREYQLEQLNKIEQILNNTKIKKFNDNVFKNMVNHIIIGGKEDNKYNPALVRFVFNIDPLNLDVSNSKTFFPSESPNRLHKTF
ncbi:MAG: recombinase family protein [Bacilli bacterium]|nr:recombinase family protein [Bacilli bacterium]